ncbi:Glyoxalase-like domain-containing protein [Desulfonatronum thiosulfatophilum]|uniref:Glyoxalase-like domain-containing protein n=1 Tax=Desulfonatronum thiosulfatophilum TaxID=617002 RepID=A0A1G6D863_9BACT|nr:VOC family protein [Desulfonatronum thiosulfatophilum]SDB41290.1 Glyoxalase-like domain-containing protein [Desulfonatronum thiosulfatophilum]
MTINSASVTFVTPKLEETRRFYELHFGARPVFDCGWYVVLRLAESGSGAEVCLMEPREGTAPFSGGAVLNLHVSDADGMYDRLVNKAGLTVLIPLEDHPWGDRGFGLQDPSGVTVYCYHPIAPAREFRKYFIEDDQDQ